MAAKKKLTLYFSEDLLEDARIEAERQDRSISWVLEQAWKMARERMKDVPGVEDLHLSLEPRN
ncbi:TIGR04563 family protein [Microvenator marinus]|jgi:uncharacterized small protein (TIGR04563 family)|uniref:TIGR04563 family protein n=1 Tax=Microvenator marinus TaxID=2600177 RepID=A0A5B8XLL1_9DELT|nr:TIGR04563 family protein [Microvenator marinus]QED26011.1 TIGR04563 family protein [Microvenator marinus]